MLGYAVYCVQRKSNAAFQIDKFDIHWNIIELNTEPDVYKLGCTCENYDVFFSIFYIFLRFMQTLSFVINCYTRIIIVVVCTHTQKHLIYIFFSSMYSIQIHWVLLLSFIHSFILPWMLCPLRLRQPKRTQKCRMNGRRAKKRVPIETKTNMMCSMHTYNPRILHWKLLFVWVSLFFFFV